MREYKFRGKRIDNGEWVYGYYFISEQDIEDGFIWRDIPQIQQRYGDHFQYFDVDLATVGQYTGLYDKNGKEIYEGDILRFTHEREDFINTDARIAVEIPKIYYMIDNPYNHSFEVIGNIYENPELLKKDYESI